MQMCTISGNVNGAAIMENSDSQKKKKNSTTILSSNYIPGHIFKGNKITILLKYLQPPCNIIYNSQDMKPAHIFFLIFENEHQSTISQVSLMPF